MLLRACPIISIDNVNGELGGDTLCQAIERPLISVRPLGGSGILEIESRACINATGNGLRVRGDMVRRSLVAALDAGMERPELRQFSSDPVADVLADRGGYVAACLTVCRAYILAGCPNPCRALASFQDWSRVVRSALVWLDCEDPCRSMETAREDDPELTDLREILTLWTQTFGEEGRTAREAADEASSRKQTVMGEPTEFSSPELRDALLRVAGDKGNINTKKLGEWLKNQAGRIVDGVRIVKAAKVSGGVIRWAVRRHE
jgi:putative DNA primase/helicase